MSLVGTRDGQTVCAGTELEGARFTVRSWLPSSRTILIKEVRNYVASNGEVQLGYLLTDGAGVSLCRNTGSNQLLTELGLRRSFGADTDPSPTDEVAIAVRSELYDFYGAAVVPRVAWKDHSREWNHLACAGDGLAKRSLYDLHTDNVQRSRAALRMLTGSYCARQTTTVRGALVQWHPPVTGADDLEARWTANGAACISKPRMLWSNANEASVPADLPPRLEKLCPKCNVPQWLEAIQNCPRQPKIPLCVGAAETEQRPFMSFLARQ